MAIQSGFFKSVNGDRKYLAQFFTSYFATFIGNGVFPNPSNNLQVVSQQNLTIGVNPGKGWINGNYMYNDELLALTLAPADGTLNRIDRVVFAVDLDLRNMNIYVKQGTPASSPVAPDLIRNNTVYELALADVRVNRGTVAITQANITDTRMNNDLCGIVHGTVDQVDTTTVYNQYLQYLEELRNDSTQEVQNLIAQNQQDFDTWFASVQDELNEDVAGNLQNQINALVANTQIADIVEAREGLVNNKLMTPLRVREANRFYGLPGISDLNEVVLSGRYYLQSNTLSANIPSDLNTTTATYLEVLNSASNNLPAQLMIQPANGYIWFRTRRTTTVSNLWTDWKRLDNRDVATTAQALQGTVDNVVMTPLKVQQKINQIKYVNTNYIETNTIPINDYRTNGTYRLANTTFPELGLSAGTYILEVQGDGTIAKQTFTLINTNVQGDVYNRTYSQAVGWSPLKKQTQENLPSLQTSDKTSLVAAINEVKSQANDIKTKWASVIGSPLLSSDTQAQLQSKTQTLKNTLANNIASKGVGAFGSETLSTLVGKVAQINQGPRTLSGTTKSSVELTAFQNYPNGTQNNYRFLEIRNIGFMPRRIIVKGLASPSNSTVLFTETIYDRKISYYADDPIFFKITTFNNNSGAVASTALVVPLADFNENIVRIPVNTESSIVFAYYLEE